MRIGDFDELKKRLHEYCIDNDPECQKYYDFLGIDDCINNVPTVVNEYTKGFADGERSGRNFPLTDEEKAILVRQWRPQGKWILVDDTEKFIAKCSVCGRIEDSRMVKDYPFCHCGADMKGGAE